VLWPIGDVGKAAAGRRPTARCVAELASKETWARERIRPSMGIIAGHRPPMMVWKARLVNRETHHSSCAARDAEVRAMRSVRRHDKLPPHVASRRNVTERVVSSERS